MTAVRPSLRENPATVSRSSTGAAGYSGTPLAKKLGMKPGALVCTFTAPAEYQGWLEPLPPGAILTKSGAGAKCDLVHLFVRTLGELERHLPRARRLIKPDGGIWVSWYKKSSGVPTDVTEDSIRALALRTDLVDVKVCAVTQTWSGLKLVVRKHLR